ncbi:MAG TPA: FAD-dependent oxidoreductase [Mycobacteriales bacterium]|nr:FAD-dependent oxidoreductase [Mycobacteriales bacterium]
MGSAEHTRLLIIGGGAAGYTAAIYTGRAGLKPICIEGYGSGGQIIRSPQVDNFPGFPGGVSGVDLAARMREQAESFGTRMILNDAISVDFGVRPFRVATDEHEFRADAVIVATGAYPRSLGLAAEEEFVGRGIAYCAVCDGAFFAGKRVTVVGGGDAAVGEALSLRKVASSVTLIHRREELRASTASQAALAEASDITVLTPYTVAGINGDDAQGVTGLTLSRVGDGETSTVDTDGLFVAIGHEPATSLFAPWLETDRGWIVTQPGRTATSMPGVFAAGEVSDVRYRQAITAAAAGCAAAIDAERWLITLSGDATASVDAVAYAVHVAAGEPVVAGPR